MTDTMTPAPDEETQETPDAEAPEQAPTTPADEGAPTMEGATEIPTFPGKEPKHKGKEGEIEKIADDYVIPLSDEAIKDWAKVDPEQFKAYAEQVAVGMYPTFAPQIQAGIPTRILLDPYVQVAQQLLGPVMTEPNWSDPKWGAALQGGVDPKTGRPIPMTLNEWRTFLMQHPNHNYLQSPHAMERAQNFSDALNASFSGKMMPGAM